MLAIVAVVCLGILGAWFLLQTEIAEVLLIIIVSSAAAAGMYWLWTERWDSAIAKSVTTIAWVVIFLGVLRLGIENLCDMLTAFLRTPGTKRRAAEGASISQAESGEHHRSAVPR